jgi:hypothetical protein
MLVIAKRTMLFREQVGVIEEGTPVKKPWEVLLKVGIAPQEAPDFLSEDLAFQGAVAAGAIILLQPPKLAA